MSPTAVDPAREVMMPRLSDSMEEGTVLTWMKQVGDRVALGEELAEIETDKANMAFESDVTGTVLAIVVAEGESVAVGEVIAWIGPPGAELPKPAASPTPATQASPETVVPPSETARDTRVKASPIARRLAQEAGLDLGSVPATGPGGRIVKADVTAALASGSAPNGTDPSTPEGDQPASSAAQPQPGSSPGERTTPSAPAPSAVPAGSAVPEPEAAKGAVEVVELSKLQRTVSRRMAESKATAPHFYLQAEIDMDGCYAARRRLKADAAAGNPIPSFNDMVVKACAIALAEHPKANGSYLDGRLELYDRINVGIAVAGKDALVVPTVFDADRKGLRQIASESRALATRVREQKITQPELSGGTFTVSNLGMFGVSNFHPVINLPQAAILAVGAIEQKPVIRGGEITLGRMMGATLACDHRVLYGADGAQFLARVRALLEEPLGLAN